MATIVKRVNPSGETVYRAQIRIKKAGYPNFTESKTFSKRALAVAWARKRETELEENPNLLLQRKKTGAIPTLKEASERYLSETQFEYVTTKASVIRLLGDTLLGGRRIDRLRRSDFAEYAMARQRGMPEYGLKPVSPATINGDLQYLRTILKHAHFVWGMESVVWTELDLAMEGLRRARIIAKSQVRMRLPTSDELLRLTRHFYQRWHDYPGVTSLPMHLIMWFAIYSTRRQGEIGDLKWVEYNSKHREWLVRDVKHPRGSKGNHKYFSVRDELLPVLDAIKAPDIQNQIKRRGGDLDFVFGGTPSRSISAAWRNACKVLGIEDLRFHDLRHEGATRLAEMGLSVPHIQQVTLHGDWHVLQRYVNMGTRPRENLVQFEQAMRFARCEE